MWLKALEIAKKNRDKKFETECYQNVARTYTQSTLTTIANSLIDTGQISTIAGNLGIPLTGGLAAGFAIGLMKRLMGL